MLMFIHPHSHVYLKQKTEKTMHNKLNNKRNTVWIWVKKKAQCKRKEWQRQQVFSFLVLYFITYVA